MNFNVQYYHSVRMFSKQSGKRKLFERTLVCRFHGHNRHAQNDTHMHFKIKTLVLSKEDLMYLRVAGAQLPRYVDIESFSGEFLRRHCVDNTWDVYIYIALGVEDLVDAKRTGDGDILKINNQLLSKTGTFYAKDI